MGPCDGAYSNVSDVLVRIIPTTLTGNQRFKYYRNQNKTTFGLFFIFIRALNAFK